MKAQVWQGPYEVTYGEAPTPVPGDGEALIKIEYAGICGSDLTIYQGKHWRSKPPMIMGHEFAGEIAEVRSANSGLKVGDKVTVEPLISCGHCYACKEGSYHVCKTLGLYGVDTDGGFAEYVKVPADKVYKVPDGMPMQHAALAEPTAVAAHDVRRSKLKIGDHAVVLGGGPIGLLVAQIARLVTGRPVELVEISDWRLDLARKMGFDPIDAKKADVMEEVMARTDGDGADVVYDVAGAAATAALLPHLTKIHGQVVIIAMPKDHRPVDLAAFALREVELTGCRVYNYIDFRNSINLLAEGKIASDLMISHIMSLENGKEGLDLALKGADSMKILLKP